MKSYNDYLDEQEQSWIVKDNNEMEMKTVKIMIEVEVPKEATHAAVDKHGMVSYRLSNEEYPIHTSIRWNTYHLAKVANWRETLTEVKQGE